MGLPPSDVHIIAISTQALDQPGSRHQHVRTPCTSRLPSAGGQGLGSHAHPREFSVLGWFCLHHTLEVFTGCLLAADLCRKMEVEWVVIDRVRKCTKRKDLWL